MTAFIALTVLVALALLASRYGYDSRERSRPDGFMLRIAIGAAGGALVVFA